VYKAKPKSQADSAKAEFVALKKIKQEKETEGFPITALREIMLLSKLKHKNVLNLIEVVHTPSKQIYEIL